MDVLSVTGMHRSGTSLVMAWLNQCGLKVGHGGLVPASIGNQKGHFEDKEFVKLHEQTLRQHIPDSKGWIVTDETQLAGVHLDQIQPQTLIEERVQHYSFWGWKDPRTIFFLEDWKDRIPGLKVVGVWRPCDEVVASLRRRARKRKIGKLRISYLRAARLWKLTNRQLLSYMNRHPNDTLLLALNDVLNDDKHCLERINGMLGSAVLEYIPIGEVYDASLMQHRPHSILAHLLKYDPGVREITKDLIDRTEHDR